MVYVMAHTLMLVSKKQIILVNGVPSRIGKKRNTLFTMYGRVRQKALQQFSSRLIIKIQSAISQFSA